MWLCIASVMCLPLVLLLLLLLFLPLPFPILVPHLVISRRLHLLPPIALIMQCWLLTPLAMNFIYHFIAKSSWQKFSGWTTHSALIRIQNHPHHRRR